MKGKEVYLLRYNIMSSDIARMISSFEDKLRIKYPKKMITLKNNTTIDLDNKRVSRSDGNTSSLTDTQYAIILQLINSPNTLISWEDIYTSFWGEVTEIKNNKGLISRNISDINKLLVNNNDLKSKESPPISSFSINGSPYYKISVHDFSEIIGSVCSKHPGIKDIQTPNIGTELTGEEQFTIIWYTGRKYTGQLIDGDINGQGTMEYDDGSKYIGQFLNGFFHGTGTLIYPEDNPYGYKEYTGDWHKSMWHGEGKLYTKDGSIYDGDFKNNKAEGYGILTYVDHPYGYKEYSGDLKNNLYEGTGTMIYTEDNAYGYKKYTGDWKNNLYEGTGTMIYADDNPSKCLIYKGEWHLGMRHGKGILIYKSADMQYGIFENDILKDGKEIYLRGKKAYILIIKNNAIIEKKRIMANKLNSKTLSYLTKREK